MSYLQHISPFATFSSFSKVVSSISTLTTSHLHLLCSLAPRDVHPVKHVIWHSSPNLPAIFDISMVSLILSPMHSPAMFQPLSKHLSNLRPWLPLSSMIRKFDSCHRPTHHFSWSICRSPTPLELFSVTLLRELRHLLFRRSCDITSITNFTPCHILASKHPGTWYTFYYIFILLRTADCITY